MGSLVLMIFVFLIYIRNVGALIEYIGSDNAFKAWNNAPYRDYYQRITCRIVESCDSKTELSEIKRF